MSKKFLLVAQLWLLLELKALIPHVEYYGLSDDNQGRQN